MLALTDADQMWNIIAYSIDYNNIIMSPSLHWQYASV